MLNDTTLSLRQYDRLDHIAEALPETKVISWDAEREGPVLFIQDELRTVNRDGRLVSTRSILRIGRMRRAA